MLLWEAKAGRWELPSLFSLWRASPVGGGGSRDQLRCPLSLPQVLTSLCLRSILVFSVLCSLLGELQTASRVGEEKGEYERVILPVFLIPCKESLRQVDKGMGDFGPSLGGSRVQGPRAEVTLSQDTPVP